MKLQIMVLLFTAAFVTFGVMGCSSKSSSVAPADEALKKLMDGNARYVANQMNTIGKSGEPSVRQALVSGQKPFAIILCCSDSRVPPEIIFDKSLGEIFVVRVAGNIADPVILGSIEYAAEHLGSPLVMVLGHQKCGAVGAAVEAHGETHGNIGSILKAIQPAVEKAKKESKGEDNAALIDAAVNNNVEITMKELTANSPIIKELVSKNKLKIVGAKYELESGKVVIAK